MQYGTFKIVMKSNVIVAMEVPFHVFFLIHFWRTLKTS
jgi:hypothetical protein